MDEKITRDHFSADDRLKVYLDLKRSGYMGLVFKRSYIKDTRRYRYGNCNKRGKISI